MFRRPAADQPLPDERERLAVALGGRRGARPRSAVVAGAGRGARRPRGVAWRPAHAPGLHPTRTRAVLRRRRAEVGVVGEVDPDGGRGAGGSRPGRPGSRSTSAALLRRPHGRGAIPPGEPLPVERHRPGLRGRRAVPGRRRRAAPSGRRPATCCATCGCSTSTGATGVGRGPPQPGLPPPLPGPRPHPHRRRGGRGPPRPASTPSSRPRRQPPGLTSPLARIPGDGQTRSALPVA